jgi:hypothetical protein
MKKYTFILFLVAVSSFSTSYAGKLFEKVKHRIKESTKKVSIGSKAKSAIKTGLGFIPGGGVASHVLDQFTGGTDSEKIDGIFDGVIDISSDLMELKKLTEDVYFREMQARKRAADLAEGMKKANMKKMFGAMVEGTLNVPINPAEYIPNLNESTSKLKKNLDLDMDHERKLVRENGFALTGSRRALLKSQPDLWKKDPQKFRAELREAEKFEGELDEALRAQDMAMLKILKAEIIRLQEENKNLAQNLKKPGTKPTEVIQTQQAITNNNGRIIDLQEKVQEGFKKATELSNEEKMEIGETIARQDSKKLKGFLRARREQIKRDYRHLSLLNF